MSVLHIAALNPDSRVLEYMIKKVKLLGINLDTLITAPDTATPSVKSLKKTYTVYSEWTPMNIALMLGDTQKMDILIKNNLASFTTQRTGEPFSGSLIQTSLNLNGDMAPSDRDKYEVYFNNKEFLVKKMMLCDLAIEQLSIPKMFNYEESFDKEKTITYLAKEFHEMRYYTNYFLLFRNEKFSSDCEFRQTVAPAIIRLYASLQSDAYHNAAKSVAVFLTFVMRGLIEHEKFWTLKELDKIKSEMLNMIIKNSSINKYIETCLQNITSLIDKKQLESLVMEKPISSFDGLTVKKHKV